MSIPADETQRTFPSQIELRLFKPFCCQITSLNNPPLFLPPLLFFWLSPLLFSVSLFRFPTKASTGRQMIRLPLIDIRFTGLEQHRAGWSQNIAHICVEERVVENLSVSSRLAHHQFLLTESYRPAITHSAPRQTSSKRTHV